MRDSRYPAPGRLFPDNDLAGICEPLQARRCVVVAEDTRDCNCRRGKVMRSFTSPLHRGANHRTNGRRQTHRESTPKHHANGGSQNFGAAGFRTDHP